MTDHQPHDHAWPPNLLPPPPPPLPPGSARSPRRALAGVGGFIALGLAAGVAMWASASNDEQTQPPPTQETTTTTGPTTNTGAWVDPHEIVTGQCLDESTFGEPASHVGPITVADCVVPHDVEVIDVFDLGDAPGTPYPGDGALFDAASERCEKAFAKYVGTSYHSSALELGLYGANEAAWTKYDDRWMVCYALDPDFEPLTGSVAGTGR